MSAHRADRDGVPAYNCPSCCAWSQLVTAMLTAVDRSGCTDAAPAHFYPPAAFECCREQSLTVCRADRPQQTTIGSRETGAMTVATIGAAAVVAAVVAAGLVSPHADVDRARV